MKRFFLYSLLILALVSCREEPKQSAVDPLPFPMDEKKDTTVSPGDDFFQYCNGTWYNQTPTPADGAVGAMYDADVVMKQRVDQLINTTPSLKAFYTELDNMYGKPDESMAYLQAQQAAVPRPATYEEAFATMGKLLMSDVHVMGLEFLTSNLHGTIYGFFYFPAYLPQVPEDTASAAMDGLPADLKINRQLQSIADQWIPAREAVAQLPVFECILQGMNINTQYVYVASREDMQRLESLRNMSLDDLYNIMLEAWEGDYFPFVSEEKLAAYNAKYPQYAFTADAIHSRSKYLANYLLSYHIAKAYVTEEFKQKYLSITKEMHSTFRQRIAGLDWMSETTRNNALRKLDEMHLFVAYPDQWYTDCVPDLSDCGTFIEMAHRLAQCNTQLRIHTLGTQDFFSYMIPQYVVTATINTSYDLSLTNAFYSPNLNSIFIYPSLLFSPVIPEGVSEARTFAAFTIIGHEMTHGFDLQGSNYNAWGEKESWWTVADKMEFDDRNRLLIDCYNHLQFDPFQYPNTFANGERTVTENVADLGGFMIVLDAYIAYLKKNGYFGESYLNQLRRFYESYADLWAVKYSAKKLQSIIDEDVHSHARCRINGVVMNTDLWYELYHVDRDNVLYLPKERRTYIW